MNQTKILTVEEILERTEKNGTVSRMYINYLINLRRYGLTHPRAGLWNEFCGLVKEKYGFKNPPEEELERLRSQVEEYGKKIDSFVNSRNNLSHRLYREFPLKYRNEEAVIKLVRNNDDLRVYNDIISDIRGEEERLVKKFISEWIVK